MSSGAALNKKTFTNLYEEPQLAASLFEPIAPFTYDLGSSTQKWSEVWVNRVNRSTYPVECVIPTGIQGSADPPATRALNSGYEFYLKVTSSSNIRVFQYDADSASTYVELTPPIGSLFFGTATGSSSHHIYTKISTSGWARYGITQS